MSTTTARPTAVQLGQYQTAMVAWGNARARIYSVSIDLSDTARALENTRFKALADRVNTAVAAYGQGRRAVGPSSEARAEALRAALSAALDYARVIDGAGPYSAVNYVLMAFTLAEADRAEAAEALK